MSPPREMAAQCTCCWEERELVSSCARPGCEVGYCRECTDAWIAVQPSRTECPVCQLEGFIAPSRGSGGVSHGSDTAEPARCWGCVYYIECACVCLTMPLSCQRYRRCCRS